MSIRFYRLLNAIVLLAIFAGSAWAYPRLPERIPMHFDLAGRADNWAVRSPVSWFLLPAVAAGVALFLHLASAYSAGHPELWNLPDKRRFLALHAEDQAPIIARMQELMALLGVIVTALLGVLQAGVYHAATGRTEGLPLFASLAIGTALLAMVVLGIRLNRTVARMVREAHARAAAE